MDQDKGEKGANETRPGQVSELQEARAKPEVHIRWKEEKKDSKISEVHNWS